jgi:hypothetical protein
MHDYHLFYQPAGYFFNNTNNNLNSSSDIFYTFIRKFWNKSENCIRDAGKKTAGEKKRFL